MIKKLEELKIQDIVAPIGSAEYGKTIKARFKNTIAETKILPEDMCEILVEYDEITSYMNSLKQEKEMIEHIIMSQMEEHETAYIKDREITWKKTSRCTLDTKRLKEEEPEIYEQYSKTSSSRVFKIK